MRVRKGEMDGSADRTLIDLPSPSLSSMSSLWNQLNNAKKKKIGRKQTNNAMQQERVYVWCLPACLYLSIWLQLDPSTGRQKNRPRQTRQPWRRDGRTHKQSQACLVANEGCSMCPLRSLACFMWLSMYKCVNKVISNTRFSPPHLSTLNRERRYKKEGESKKGPHGTYSWCDTRTHTWASQAK